MWTCPTYLAVWHMLVLNCCQVAEVHVVILSLIRELGKLWSDLMVVRFSVVSLIDHLFKILETDIQ